MTHEMIVLTLTDVVFSQVWFSNRRARLRKCAQSSSPGYNPLALNMSYGSPASAYMPGAPMETAETAGSGLYSSAMQGLTSYASNIMGHTMNQYAAQSSLLSSQVCTCSNIKMIDGSAILGRF